MNLINAYYDRKNQFFTVQETNEKYQIIKKFEKLPARSGQHGYIDSWTRGKSPIPFSVECVNDLYIWLDCQLQKGEWAGARGIGEFWKISTDPDMRTIRGKNGKYRQDIGAHPENDIPGSAGCIVFLHRTQQEKENLLSLRNFLLNLKERIEKIKLTVC
jgi:hypothetical protein